MKLIYKQCPQASPEPVTTFTDGDRHFYVCRFLKLKEGPPDAAEFCQSLAKLHSYESPDGNFGFHCATYNGDLRQNNTASQSWANFFKVSLEELHQTLKSRLGPSFGFDARDAEQFNGLFQVLLDLVVPNRKYALYI
jgi:protein-ribulosamine 3-kinase